MAPIHLQPRMEVSPRLENKRETIDQLDEECGYLIERSEMFRMHTIERGRLLSMKMRIPPINTAFRAGP